MKWEKMKQMMEHFEAMPEVIIHAEINANEE
jgi:hypothetical protein